MSDYLRVNSEYWKQGVYDTPNVESYVFRIYGRIVKHQFGLDGSGGESLLDFGCGSGGSVIFFDSKGFNTFGVDQSAIDIDRCRRRLPHRKDQLKVIDPNCSPYDDWFGNRKFRVITSFQVLYYLDDEDLENRLISLLNMLEEGGLFVATMMHRTCWYYGMSEPHEKGLRFVRFRRDQDIGRPNLTLNDHYINFTDDEDDLKRKFHMFKPIHTKGFYDGVYRDDQGSEKHLVFVGQKE